ncbi:Conserved_hypothetical protein [Hexamita inflata]|uniref:EGF-like domain-containing protein n=1 Tax=Hexamita inflata TaxID=28002 RepID=A0AA86RCD1_9EUKA|nr:Conserved hypothetical protein [Hexamita inflata]
MILYLFSLLEDTLSQKYISSIRDLKYIDANTPATYELQRDIDGKNAVINPIQFQGIFNGNGYMFKNLVINSVQKGDGIYAGLFSSLCQNQSINNLTLQNVTIRMEQVVGDIYAGILVGRGEVQLDTIRIVNCSITIVGANVNRYTGGVIGFSDGHTNIVNSEVYNLSIKNYHFQTSDTDGFYAGGIVGKGDFVSFYLCYTDMNYLSSTRSHLNIVGGVIGHGNTLNLTMVNSEIKITVRDIFGFYGGAVGFANDLLLTNVYAGLTSQITEDSIQLVGSVGVIVGKAVQMKVLDTVAYVQGNEGIINMVNGQIQSAESMYFYSTTHTTTQSNIKVQNSWLGNLTVFDQLSPMNWKIIKGKNHNLPRIYISDKECQMLSAGQVCALDAKCVQQGQSLTCQCMDGFRKLNGVCVATNCPYINGVECGSGTCNLHGDKFTCDCVGASCTTGQCMSCHPQQLDGCIIQESVIKCAQPDCQKDWTGEFCSICVGLSCSLEVTPICVGCQNKDGICFNKSTIYCQGTTECKVGYTDISTGCRTCAENYEIKDGVCVLSSDAAAKVKSNAGVIAGAAIGALLLLIALIITIASIAAKKKKEEQMLVIGDLKQKQGNAIQMIDNNTTSQNSGYTSDSSLSEKNTKKSNKGGSKAPQLNLKDVKPGFNTKAIKKVDFSDLDRLGRGQGLNPVKTSGQKSSQKPRVKALIPTGDQQFGI